MAKDNDDDFDLSKAEKHRLVQWLFKKFEDDMANSRELDNPDQAVMDVMKFIQSGHINDVTDKQFADNWYRVDKSKKADFDRYMELERDIYKLQALTGFLRNLAIKEGVDANFDLSKMSISEVLTLQGKLTSLA